MFWTRGLVLVALTFGQVLAGLVKPGVPEVFVEDTNTGLVQPDSVHGWLTKVTGLDFENLNEKDEVTEATGPLTREASEPDNEDNDENFNESDSSESDEDPPSGSVSELVNKLKIKESDSLESNADPLSGSVSELVNKPVVKVKITVNNIVNDKKN